MPNQRRFLGGETLPQLVALLSQQGVEQRPRLWTSDSKHDIPYARPAPFKDKDKQDARKLEDVVLQGAPMGAKAVRLETGASKSCPMGAEYLVSDGFASCVPVMGVTAKEMFLVHINVAPIEYYLKGWDKAAAVMILRKKSPASYHQKVKEIADYCHSYFYGGVDIDDIPWYGSVGVIAFRSTWIAYLESSSVEQVIAPGGIGNPMVPHADAVAAAAAVGLVIPKGYVGSGGAAAAAASAAAGAYSKK